TLEQMADGYVDDVFDSKEETEIKPDETATPPSPSSRGGARAGAGRKSIGVKRTVSIALPQEGWDQIDKAIASGEFKSASQFFRFLMGFTEGGD
ncbi:type II toxin-antitoxin system ParD family antitoxin, partial [Cohnella sp. GCM10020058]|uniref:ribbon-helix-helix domain-containing protein n=1 Tax=Cohnella sp. GCM10020058 TaxID=3317330 RepID=UPI00363098F1